MQSGALEPDYLEITREILSGSDLSLDMLSGIAEAAKNQDDQAMFEVLGDGDFSWPWFDQAFEEFDELDQWPEVPAWSWFERRPVFYTDKASVLARFKGKTLKDIAGREGIPIDPSARVSEIRSLLESTLTVKQLKPYADALNRKVLSEHQNKANEAKRLLLSKSIIMRAYNLSRHQTLMNLIRHRGDAKVVWGSKLAQTLAGDYEFMPGDTSRLPPFFPGDETSFKAIERPAGVEKTPQPRPSKNKSDTTENRKKALPFDRRVSWLVAIAMIIWIANTFYHSFNAPKRGNVETVRQVAEFSTLGRCMVRLQEKLGSRLLILIDEPDVVSGQQRNGMNWACSRKHTGTKGIHWQGWYDSRSRK